MNYPVLLWWWFAGTGGGGGGAGTAGGTSGATLPLILAEPPLAYSTEYFLRVRDTLERAATTLHRTTGDMYHPYSLTVRQRVIFPWTAFADGDATPSVLQGRNFKTANTTPTTVTNFDDGVDGQEILVRIDDASTVFDFTASSLVGNAGADYIASNGDRLRATYDAEEGVWYCTIESV